jgi:hypothetical protein
VNLEGYDGRDDAYKRNTAVPKHLKLAYFASFVNYVGKSISKLQIYIELKQIKVLI